MSEDTFRQERRPINRSEVQNTTSNATPNVNPFQNVEVVRNAVQEETQNFTNMNTNLEERAFQLPPNAPKELLNRINEVNNQGPPQQNFNQQVAQQAPAPNPRFESNLRIVGSQKLEQLIGGIKEISDVYEEVQLPSLGRFYDGKDGPTDGKIHVRVMTGEEEQILTTQRLNRKGVAMNMIFDRCIKECGSNGYRSENFLSIDRTWLLIYLRGISYGSDYSVEITCPFTNNKFNETINLDLDVDYCPDDFGPETLFGTLPKTKYQFRYKLATGADEQRIIDYREKKSKFDTSNQTDDTLLYRSALLIEDMEGLTDKREIQQLLKKLPMQDLNYIRNLTTSPPFGVNTRIDVVSPFTSEEFEIELPIESNFFFPKQRRAPSQN